MTITATFGSFEEMMEFVQGVAGRTETARNPEDSSGPDTAPHTEPAKTVPSVPVAQPTVPVSKDPVQAAETVPTVPAFTVPVQASAAVPTATPAAAVPTSDPVYTMDDLARAAMTLMDSGRQLELQNLLARFGCEALPALPKSQYGAFATALRGMGAQI